MTQKAQLWFHNNNSDSCINEDESINYELIYH